MHGLFVTSVVHVGFLFLIQETCRVRRTSEAKCGLEKQRG